MSSKVTYTGISEKFIFLLLTISMLLTKDIKAADFPIYSLLLLLTAFGWMAAGIFLRKGAERHSRQIRYWTDLMAILAVLYEVAMIIGKLFQNPDKGGIDFSGNAEVLAFAALYFLISSGITFQQKYFDLILYSGLLLSAVFLYPHVTGVQLMEYGSLMLKDTGATASCFLLICMISVYQYCTCKDKLRSWFYLAISVIGFLALLLNQNVVSFWLMAAYFVAIPILLRPTAQLVKKDMQLFFLFGFMLSNMSLFSQYTPIFVTELSYSLEHSVYLDLLLAAGGILFFHYWEKIPEGVDLERLVMRKMRRAYKVVLMVMIILFVGIVTDADRWAALGGSLSEEAWKGFALPLVGALKQSESGFYFCFRETGILTGIFFVVFLVFMIGRLRRNYGMDKPLTGILILITVLFMVQLLFFKPAANTLTVYFMLLLFGAFHKEDKNKMVSTRIREETLRKQNKKEGGVLI